jgi:16S rRNA (guanine527-N7)-methyltransferase
VSPLARPRAGAPESDVHGLRGALDQGLAALALDLDDGVRGKLLAYLGLLARWNRVYNLTAVRDPGEMVSRLLLDCLAVLPHLRGDRLLDVGSGAGLPGLVLAMAEPRASWVLLDSGAKKRRFLVQAAMELELANVRVVQARLEEFHPDTRFSTIISRAFASLVDFATARRLLEPGGQLLAMKGRYPEEEIGALGEPIRSVRLQIPGLEHAHRHLVIIEASEAL